MTNTQEAFEAHFKLHMKITFDAEFNVYFNKETGKKCHKETHRWEGWQANQAHNDAVIAELVEALEDAQESLGRFTSDEGSTQKDFDTCDRVHFAIAKHKKV